MEEGGGGSEKKTVLEIQQTTERGSAGSRTAKGRRHHNSAGRRYTRRQEVKQGKGKNRGDLKSSPPQRAQKNHGLAPHDNKEMLYRSAQGDNKNVLGIATA